MIDWGAGRYEHTAAELEPVAEHVVSLAGLKTGQTVVDLATGTGNAALLAARAGAVVTGLDAAPRLIEVAASEPPSPGFRPRFWSAIYRLFRLRMAPSTGLSRSSG